MRISVVIPAYNEEKYIRTCLASLMRQTDKPYEIIVVDNNSTDNTAAIARKFDGVKIITEHKQGITPTRNAGFNSAKGDIIARTDADAVVPPNWIKLIKKNMENADVAGISGPVILYDIYFSRQITTIQTFIFFNVSKLFLKHTALYGPNLAIRRNYWQQIRSSVCSNDKDVHEDLDLAIHLAPFGKIMFVPELKTIASARRIKSNILSILFDYNIRFWKTIFNKNHKPN